MKSFSSFVVIMALICLTSCSQQKKADSKAPVSVDVYSVDDMSGSESKDYVGTVEEKTGSTLSFEVAGNITSLRVDEGDHVSRGQVIATINPISLKEAHRATLVTLKQAQDAYNRFLPLHKSGTISDMRWVDIESKLEQAQAAESIARQQLSHSTLTAPFSGVIASKEADMGSYVLPGQPIVKLADVAQVNVKISVPEAEISHIHVGDGITATVAALGGARFDGVITEKGIDANPVSHTYDVKALIANSHGKLLPGMVCNAKVHANAKSQQGIPAHVIVPAGCIELDVDNSRFVWTVVNGKAHQQHIQVGDFEGDGVIVLSGLKSGDMVIVGGQQKVSEGMKVSTSNHQNGKR